MISSTIQRATVVFGGTANEHDISILTGLQAERVLAGAGVTVQPVYWSRTDEWFLVPTGLEARDFIDGVPSGAKKLELRIGAKKGSGFYVEGGLGGGKLLETGPIMSCFHGGAGESGGAQALFELLGLKATGGTVSAAALGMDKLAFGGVMEAAGVPALKRTLLSAEAPPPFDGPYIVKPRFGGSSIGIEVVEDWETAVALLATSPDLREGAVVEPNRPDLFDLNVSVRTAPTLAVSEIEKPLRPADGAIFSYAEKYLRPEGLSAAPREFPADISPELRATIQSLAARVVELSGLTGIAAHRLPLRRHRGVRQRGQLDPRRAGALPLARHPARRRTRRRAGGGPAGPSPGHRQLRGGRRPPRRGRHRRQARRAAAAAPLTL